MNTIHIIGRVGSDPESRMTADGQKLTTFRFASNVWKSGAEETMWWRVTIWGERCNRILPHLKKGSALQIVGTMKNPTVYQGRDGNYYPSLDVTAEMISFLPVGKRDRSDDTDNGYASASTVASGTGSSQDGETMSFSGTATSSAEQTVDDDLPF